MSNEQYTNNPIRILISNGWRINYTDNLVSMIKYGDRVLSVDINRDNIRFGNQSISNLSYGILTLSNIDFKAISEFWDRYANKDDIITKTVDKISQEGYRCNYVLSKDHIEIIVVTERFSIIFYPNGTIQCNKASIPAPLQCVIKLLGDICY